MGWSPPRAVAEPPRTADEEYGCGKEVIKVRKMRVGLGALVMLLALSLPMAAFAKGSSSITVDGITVRLQNGVCDLTGNGTVGQGTVSQTTATDVQNFLDTLQMPSSEGYTGPTTGLCGQTNWTLSTGNSWPGQEVQFATETSGGTPKVLLSYVPSGITSTPETPYTAIFAIGALGVLGIWQVIRRRRNPG